MANFVQLVVEKPHRYPGIACGYLLKLNKIGSYVNHSQIQKQPLGQSHHMANYRLTPLAEDDLESIWLYTFETWSAKQADSYYIDIIAAIENLASGRVSGRQVDIRPDYLKYSVGKHLIFYRPLEREIEVVRVLHQSMDTERYL